MADDPGGEGTCTEAEIREIVREEIENGVSSTTRRGLLGLIGLVGLGGLAGRSGSDGRDSTPEDALSGENETSTIRNPTKDTGTWGYFAERGDVQSSLDHAFEDGVGRVGLIGGVDYEFDSSIEVPPGVLLDCTGARIDLGADVNAFELHTQSQVVNPTVRTAHIDGYSSSIFHVYPAQFDERFGTNRPPPNWTVSGGWSEMTPGEGTCIELHGERKNPSREYNATRDSRNVYFCFVSHNCVGGRRFAYLHREGGETTRGGHVNGNVIRGFASNATRFIETDDSTVEENMVNGNKFYLATQSSTRQDFDSEWLWYAKKGERNELYEWGHNWDYSGYSDNDGDGYAESWYIGPNASKNYIWRKVGSASGGLGSTVLDESEGASNSKYLVLDQLGTPVDELEVWDDAA